MAVSFVHLHVHSEYSLVDGLIRFKPLMAALRADGMPAVALTDLGNLFGLVKFYRAAQTAGIKPLTGAELRVRNPATPTRPDRLVLLAQDDQGYRQLTRLLSRSYLAGQDQGFPQVERDWVLADTTGLIALSGGVTGDVGRALRHDQPQQARACLETWLRAFGDRFYLELTRVGHPGEAPVEEGSLALAARHGVPLVATNAVQFLRRADWEAHEVRWCINQGVKLGAAGVSSGFTPEQYLRPAADMCALFADLPATLENSVEIARRCNLELTLGRSFLPAAPGVPAGQDVNAYFTTVAAQGLADRLEPVWPAADPASAARRAPYAARLRNELEVIAAMGFAGYFLIVADFIRWARTQGIPVGPGRGSGAGSLVAYALRITDIDPLTHQLLFERFLNPERVSMPDFDVDFCMDGRDRVIAYVTEKYGSAAVAQIITFGTLGAKAVVRDVGRVLDHPYGFVDQLAKLVPFELGMTLDKALEVSAPLRQAYQTDEVVGALLDMARQLEGVARNAGTHAGGVVIAPGPLTDYTPLYCEPGGSGQVTQFDKDDVEQIGLVKFDFLGLRTLTILDGALITANEERRARGQPPLTLEGLPPEDATAFARLRQGDTTAVFQLESRGMRELIRKLQPDSFEDLTALVALFRPGPLQSGMVDDFIARKHGAAVEYPHPALAPILQSTYGVILYQEQVMQIAQVLAGYTLGGADLLRRAMGKKKPAEMARQRAVFEDGAVARGVAPEVARHIFDLIDKFAGYGFNRSHSAAYALLAYQTLWLKTHYPAPFMAAVLSADMDNTDKVVELLVAVRGLGLGVRPPCVNASAWRFTVAPAAGDAPPALRYGLGAIKGVGQAAAGALLHARTQGGPFRDLWDLCRRLDLGKVNIGVLEVLIRSGALDALGANRATLAAQLPLALKLAEQDQARAASGQGDLFAALAPPQDVTVDPQLAARRWPEWPLAERLQGERLTLGCYLSQHPLDRYVAEWPHLASTRIATLLESTPVPDRAPAGAGRRTSPRPTLLGLVASVRPGKTRRGPMAALQLDDGSGRLEVVVFGAAYQAHAALLVTDAILRVTGDLRLDVRSHAPQLVATSLSSLVTARSERAMALRVTADLRPLTPEAALALRERLIALLRAANDPQGLRLEYRLRKPDEDRTVTLNDGWRVAPTDDLLAALQALLGPEGATVVYPPRAGAGTGR